LNYDEAVKRLLHYGSQLPQKPTTQDPRRPARMRALLGAMHDPHLRYPVIHVTGTKGKGSVCAMCAAVLKAQGLRVGMYTSPHLQDIRERFFIDGASIDHETLREAVEKLAPLYEQIAGARFPEVMASTALYLFAQQQVDVALVEVSIGGRLDATNAIYPTVTVITSISYDHTVLLGDTLAKIAWEKAGIIKPGVPLVSAPQPDEAYEIIQRIADERSAPLTLIGRDWLYETLPPSLEGQRVKLARPAEAPKTYTTRLIGAHQAVNTVVALAALDQLKIIGITVSEDAIQTGLSEVFWAGRMEIVSRNPLLLLDSAHNPESALRLREAIDALFPQRPLVLVYGSKATKDIAGTIKALLPLTDHMLLTRSSDGTTDDPAHLAAIVRDVGYAGDIVLQYNLNEALAEARHLAGSSGMICVTGSMFIVGEARTLLGLAPR
jgi:dihydrofolate synthase/folylpolyglutamate synthase